MEETTQRLIVKKRIILSGKFQKKEGEPDFNKDDIRFYPIPDTYQDKVQVGEEWQGELKFLWDSRKVDKNGKKIFYRFFIPEKKISDVIKIN